jgi:hypothetical protein
MCQEKPEKYQDFVKINGGGKERQGHIPKDYGGLPLQNNGIR